MTNQELKIKVSEILVKWSMPTRQVAINEIIKAVKTDTAQTIYNKMDGSCLYSIHMQQLEAFKKGMKWIKKTYSIKS